MTIRTATGRGVGDDYEAFGLRVYRDLSGSTSFLGLVAFAITGRKLSRDDEEVLDEIAVCYHVTEPRVWPMKLARTIASMGRAIPGVISASISIDSDLIGARLASLAAQVLVEFDAHVGAASDSSAAALSFVQSRRRITGFGVPFRPFDERVVALQRAMGRRGRTTGRFWQRGELLWRTARRERQLEVNIVGAAVAALLDLGFSTEEIAPLTTVFFEPTFLANAVEGARQRAPELLSLPASAVRYVGPAARESPKKKASAASDAR